MGISSEVDQKSLEHEVLWCACFSVHTGVKEQVKEFTGKINVWASVTQGLSEWAVDGEGIQILQKGVSVSKVRRDGTYPELRRSCSASP